MVTQIIDVICRTVISQIQIVGLCRVFGSQRIDLFYNRKNAGSLPIFADIQASIFHITFITNGTGNLEIGEALHFRFLQQFSRQVGNLFVIVSPTVQLFGSLHNVHQFLKEPLVNLCQFMYLIDCVSGTECFRYYKNTFIGRLTKCFVNIRDNQFFVFHKSVHSLSYHTKTFLDRFFKSTTDSHYFTD